MGFGGPGIMEILIVGLIFCLFVLLPVVAVVYLVIRATRGGASQRPAQAGRVRCPECAEWIMPEAVKCRFCGTRLDART